MSDAIQGHHDGQIAAEVERLKDERDRALFASRFNLDMFEQMEVRAKTGEAERDAAVASEAAMRVALKRNRLGYQNILEFRKLSITEWGEQRYGALTRGEIKEEMGKLDAALATPAPAHLERLKADAGRARAVRELRNWADNERELSGEPPEEISRLFVSHEAAIACLRAVVVATKRKAIERAYEIAREGK